jgi:hypothetical protein
MGREKIMKLASTNMTIATGEGALKKSLDVPAMVHPLIPGLAVVMHPFGRFGVTHVLSGLAFSATSERANTAVQVMAEAALLGVTYGIDWLQDSEDLIANIVAEHYDKPVPFGRYYTEKEGVRTPFSVKDWIQSVREELPEFAWETESEDPGVIARELLDEFEERVTSVSTNQVSGS